jgi:hypothetical protein
VDVDPFCRAAVLLNAELNGAAVPFRAEDPLDLPLPQVDVVLAGDVFYERPLAERAVRWFRALAARGVLVLAGDAGRAYAPAGGFVEVAAYDVPTTVEIEDAAVRRARVIRCEAPARLTALVCGHVTLDRVAGGLVPGGSAYYAAHALAALGAEVRVLTAAGPDYPLSPAPPPGGPQSGGGFAAGSDLVSPRSRGGRGRVLIPMTGCGCWGGPVEPAPARG